MEKGDKIKTPDGKIETVLIANGVQVITEQSAIRGNWWHPSKLVPWKGER